MGSNIFWGPRCVFIAKTQVTTLLHVKKDLVVSHPLNEPFEVATAAGAVTSFGCRAIPLCLVCIDRLSFFTFRIRPVRTRESEVSAVTPLVSVGAK